MRPMLFDAPGASWRTASRRTASHRAATPAAAWVLGFALALLVAAGIAVPRLGLALAALAALLGLGAWVLAGPMNGFVLALCVFPVYPLARGIVTLYNLPVPLELAGMWPELVLCVVFTRIVVDHIRRRERLRLFWDDVPVLVLVLGALYGILTALIQMRLSAAMYGVHYSLTAFLFYFAARWSRPTRADLRRVVAVFLGTYATIAALSLLDYVFRSDLIVRISIATRPFGREWGVENFWKHYPRMQSLLFDENIWGSISALVSLFCLASLALRRPTARWRIYSLFLFGLSTLCVLLTMSRGALACWLAGALVLLLLRERHRPRMVAALLVLSLLIGAGVGVLRQDTRVDMLLRRVGALTNVEDRVAYDRMDQWKEATSSFRRVPSGTGIGTAGHAAVFHGGGVVADGYYFKVAAELGVFGLLTLALGIAGALWVLVRHYRSAGGLEQAVGMTAAAYLCGLCAQSVGSNAFDYFYAPHVLWTLAGLYVARCYSEEEESR